MTDTWFQFATSDPSLAERMEVLDATYPGWRTAPRPLIEEALARELLDVRMLSDNLTAIYMHATRGCISKPNTTAAAVIACRICGDEVPPQPDPVCVACWSEAQANG
jgi:hypothetical protein